MTARKAPGYISWSDRDEIMALCTLYQTGVAVYLLPDARFELRWRGEPASDPEAIVVLIASPQTTNQTRTYEKVS